MTAPDLTSPSLYIKRELRLLEFQRRVLEEVREESNPLRHVTLTCWQSNKPFIASVRTPRGRGAP